MDALAWLLGLFLCWAMMAVLGYWVAAQKHRSQLEGLILGGMFGPFGVLLEALLPSIEPERRPSYAHDIGPELPGPPAVGPLVDLAGLPRNPNGIDLGIVEHSRALRKPRADEDEEAAAMRRALESL